jgi:hypothetical protein
MKSPGLGGRSATNRSTSLKIWQVVPESRIAKLRSGYVFGSDRAAVLLKLALIVVVQILRPSSHSSLASIDRVGVGV